MFISATSSQQEEPLIDRWETMTLSAHRGAKLMSLLNVATEAEHATAIILHVCGYGYQTRGAPMWLLNGLRAWRRQHARIPLIGIFHELFATGSIWNSSFWLSGAQKYVTRELWGVCDFALAVTSVYKNQLIDWRPAMSSRVALMPVFSNVGVPRSPVPPPLARPNRIAVFGRHGLEQRVYKNEHLEQFAAFVDKFGIADIIDIGAREVSPPSRVGKARVSALGKLKAEEVSEQLLSCRYGLLSYDISRLEKSGVFAAYAAHGVVPVCINSKGRPGAALTSGRYFLSWPVQKLPDDLSLVQRCLNEWYQTHSAEKHAMLLSSWILDNSFEGAQGSKESRE
jgi:hypothetical protein